MSYQRKDYYFHKAKQEDYVARSVFKLQEIDQRFKIFRSKNRILDLGAAPGSWSQYASEKIGPQGCILGIDLQSVGLSITNGIFLVQDLQTIVWEEAFAHTGVMPPFDVVLSDMAPQTTGVRFIDQARSSELCKLVIAIADRFLKSQGHLVFKLFQSEDLEMFQALLKKNYKRVEILRPKGTRKESKEIFLVGLNLIANPNASPL